MLVVVPCWRPARVGAPWIVLSQFVAVHDPCSNILQTFGNRIAGTDDRQ